MHESPDVFIGLGSNLGDRHALLAQGLSATCAPVPDDNGEAGREEAAGHAGAHDAEAKESY